MAFDYPFSATTQDSYTQQLTRAKDGLLALQTRNESADDPTTTYNWMTVAKTGSSEEREYVPGTGFVTRGPLGVNWTSRSVEVFQGALSATSAWFLPVIDENVTIRTVLLVSDTGTTSDGSNYWTFDLYNVTQAGSLYSTPPITDGEEIVANTPYAMPPSLNLAVDALDVIEVRATATGAPTTLARASIAVVFTLRA